MVTSTKGSFHPVELVYRIGYGIIALGDLCERLWVHVAPGGDEAIPPALADRFNDLRFHLGQFERTSGGDARVANASRGLLDSLECTCGDFETAWSGPKNAWLAQALDLGEPEGAWDLKQANLPTTTPAWVDLADQLSAFVTQLPDELSMAAQLGMSHAALESLCGYGLEHHGWLCECGLKHPVDEFRALLQEAGRKFQSIATVDLDLAHDGLQGGGPGEALGRYNRPDSSGFPSTRLTPRTGPRDVD